MRALGWLALVACAGQRWARVSPRRTKDYRSSTAIPASRRRWKIAWGEPSLPVAHAGGQLVRRGEALVQALGAGVLQSLARQRAAPPRVLTRHAGRSARRGPSLSRLVELETAAGFDEARDQRELCAARRVQSNLALAAEQRRAFVRDISRLLERLAAIESYGKPTSALDGDFLLYFRLQDPAAVCDDSSCTKSLVAEYQIPSAGSLVLERRPTR